MRRFVGLFAIILLLVSALFAPALGAENPNRGLAPVVQAQGKAIPNHYIVVVKEGADGRAVAAVAGVQPKFEYTAVLNGFAAELNAGQLNAVQRNPDVEYVEEDQEATVDTTQPMDSTGQPWGLDRIDQRYLPLSGSYTYTSTGANVRAYIIDTGLQANHPEFETRASNVYDAFGGNGADCNGHGTHVGGTVAGKTYGVAKRAYLRGVRVLDCAGSGSYSGIIAGVDWVRKNRVNPAVANMSLGGGYSSSVNTAVANLANSGVFVAVAAGNSNANACNYSPASAGAAYTVAASERTDTRASFSNYGSCVDGYAPGAGIKSAWLSGGTNTISGTSMASPHVAGVAALYKATYGNASSSTIASWLSNNATPGVIKSNPTGTPNRLLYKGGL
jgi:subtilisin family serine protease